MADKLSDWVLGLVIVLIGSIIVLAIFNAGNIAQILINNARVGNSGTVQTIGLEASVSEIKWGVLYPDSYANQSLTLKNIGAAAVRMSFTTSDWVPTNASDYITLDWDYNEADVAAAQIVPVTMMLHVSPLIEGITDFNFTITFYGTVS